MEKSMATAAPQLGEAAVRGVLLRVVLSGYRRLSGSHMLSMQRQGETKTRALFRGELNL